MLAEKLADAILAKEPLPPSEAPFYVAPNWQTSQR
jgi:choline dehydrogenase